MNTASDYVVQQVDAEYCVLEPKTESWRGRVACVQIVRRRDGAILGLRLHRLVVI